MNRTELQSRLTSARRFQAEMQRRVEVNRPKLNRSIWTCFLKSVGFIKLIIHCMLVSIVVFVEYAVELF